MTDLDELIATRLFGWTEEIVPQTFAGVRGLVPGCAVCYWSADEHVPHRPHVAPAYSTDIGDAWLIVEAMRERGYIVSLDSDWTAPGEWRCALYERGSLTGIASGAEAASARGESAPEAICRCALSLPADSPQTR